MAKRDPKRSEIRLALGLILGREYDIPVVPALKELDGMEARVAELEAKYTKTVHEFNDYKGHLLEATARVVELEEQFGEYVERFLSDVECTNSERRRYKKALEQIEDLNPDEARESFGVARAALHPLEPSMTAPDDPQPCCPTCGSFSNAELQHREAENLRLKTAMDRYSEDEILNPSVAEWKLKAQQAERKLTAIAAWLETNQPDVFKRGLWEAIIIHTPKN